MSVRWIQQNGRRDNNLLGKNREGEEEPNAPGKQNAVTAISISRRAKKSSSVAGLVQLLDMLLESEQGSFFRKEFIGVSARQSF
jgi:hypothetical protein